jgi:hypothetical protein
MHDSIVICLLPLVYSQHDNKIASTEEEYRQKCNPNPQIDPTNPQTPSPYTYPTHVETNPSDHPKSSIQKAKYRFWRKVDLRPLPEGLLDVDLDAGVVVGVDLRDLRLL